MTDDAAKNAEHNKAMKALKAERDEMMKEKTVREKGLIIVHTGNGKGKSSSAFGMVMRCIAHGMPCGVVQFIKGNWITGEKRFLRERFAEECRFVVSGEGFTWETQDREADIAAARHGWEEAKAMILAPGMKLVVLDEINIALRMDYLDVANVIDALKARDSGTSVILTGRDAKPALCDYADLVSEMVEVKHPFQAGIKAQRGVDF
jgi:cob(I)alamin adenosyltransferase